MGLIVRLGLLDDFRVVQGIEVLLWLDAARKWGQFCQLDNFYLKGRRKGMGLKLVKKQQSVIIDGKGGTVSHFCGLYSDLVFICAQT